METRIPRKLSVTAAAASVVFITFVFRMVAILNATTVGFAYLIAILLVAAWWGITESIIASLVAGICLNYFFLPPIGTWAISGPENWVALFAFLSAALIASDLSNRARRRTTEANTRKIEMERLYALSRAMLITDSGRAIGDEIASELARIYEIPAVAIYDRASNVIYSSRVEDLLEVESQLRETARTGSSSTNGNHAYAARASRQDKDAKMFFAAFSLGGQSTGAVALRGAELSSAALHALLNLIAITLENARSREIVTRAQAARQSEEFKSTLLDGLAHEFKTPLTSIKAATTALLASNVSDAAQQQELLTVVDQEAERLSRLVTEATRVARIEAHNIEVNREWHTVEGLIRAVLAQMEAQCDGRRLNVCIAPNLPAVFLDPDLLQLALRQLFDNAFKYSPPGSDVRISAECVGENITISVRNAGHPLPESERARIFDKFYRSRDARRQIAGTGMGLPIARGILRAHGGDIELRGSDERGTEFVMTIPVFAQERHP